MKPLSFKTTKKTELLDITEAVREAVASSGVKEGVCLVFTPHTTAAIMLNEWEENLMNDLQALLEKLVPKGGWAHNKIDDNAEAHLKNALLGCQKLIPIQGGELVLGTWQRVILCDFDGPRARKVLVECK